MRWLCVLFPVIILLLFRPRVWSINSATLIFSLPWSERTLRGMPYLLIPSRKHLNIVSAWLFVSQLKNVIKRLNPSMPPQIMKRHLMSLWLVSMCQRWFGAVTLYTLRCNLRRSLSVIPIWSMLWRQSRNRHLVTCVAKKKKTHQKYTKKNNWRI